MPDLLISIIKNTDWDLVITALIALAGFKQWRAELIGRRRAEIAERTLILSAKAIDIIRWVRSPAGFSGDGSTRLLEDGETEDNRNTLKDYFYTKVERFSEPNSREVFDELFEMSYVFRAYFGDDATTPLDEFRKIRSEICSAAHSLIRVPKPYSDQYQKYHDRIGDIDGEDDDIQKRLNAAVKSIENICAPEIRNHYKRGILGTLTQSAKKLW